MTSLRLPVTVVSLKYSLSSSILPPSGRRRAAVAAAGTGMFGPAAAARPAPDCAAQGNLAEVTARLMLSVWSLSAT